MKFDSPLLSSLPKMPVIRPATLADTFYDRLKEQISDAERELEEGQLLSIEYSPPSGDRVSVKSLGYHNPNLIMLYGSDRDGNECTVLAHMESVQLVLRVTQGDSVEREHIGFRGGPPESENGIG